MDNVTVKFESCVVDSQQLIFIDARNWELVSKDDKQIILRLRRDY